MKTMKKLIAGALAVSLLFVQSNTTALAANTPTATKSQTLAKGQKATIKVTGKFIKSKSFKSTNTKVATVNKKGVVTAVNSGSCNIKITVTYRKTKKAKKLTKKVLTTKVTVTKKDQATSNPSAKPTKAPDEDSEVIDTSNVTFESYMDEGDVKALSKIIREQDALGVYVPDELTDSGYYEWNKETGRLTGISWAGLYLQGEISFSKFTALTYLNCFDNHELTGIDVSGNKALTDLYCRNNKLTSLDLSNNTALTFLDCSNNKLTSLDISKNTKLTKLTCLGNQLTSLDISANPDLDDIETEDDVNLIR